jgi:hypothetical protein
MTVKEGRASTAHGEEGFCKKVRRKETSRRPKHGWEDNSEINIRGIRRVGMKWINLAKDTDHWRALPNIVMKHQVP